LIGPGQKRLGQRLEARFARDLSLRPPLRTIWQIEILEPRLAVRRINRLLERRVEFSLLSDVVEDGGPTLVELPQISQPLLEPAQLGVIERPGRLLPVAGNKGTVAPLSSNEMAAATCCARTPSSSAMRRSIGFIDSELFI
jgi:hypothetical protein